MAGSGRRALVLAAAGVLVVLGVAPVSASHGQAEDEALAQAGLLQAGDFPSSWREDIGQSHLAAFVKAARRTKACKSYLAERTVAIKSPNAASSDFAEAVALASNDVAVVASLTGAEDAFAAYKDPATGKCLGEVLPKIVKADLAKRGDVGAVTTKLVQPITPVVSGAMAAAGYRLLMNAEIGGKTRQVYVENWLVQVGRALSSYDFEQRGELLDTTVATNAANAATGRLGQGIASALVAGETPALARFLPRIPGYTYEQPSEEITQSDAAAVAQNAEWLIGETDHIVSDSQGALAYLTLFEYRPELVSLPGWRDEQLVIDADGLANNPEAFGVGGAGDSVLKNFGGQPGLDVPLKDGSSIRTFFCGDIEVWITSDANVSEPKVDAFVTKFAKAACTVPSPSKLDELTPPPSNA